MAMRLYTRAELESELTEKWGLKPTKYRTDTVQFWVTPNGQHLTIPTFATNERYPDHIVDRIVDQLDLLGENPHKKPG